MENNNVSDIVSQILRSPELRNNLENTVRNLSANTSTRPAVVHQEPAHSVRQELHRLFPSIHRTTEVTRRSKRKRDPIMQSFFYKEIILVKTPNAISTLKGPSKSFAFEKGFGLSNVQFNPNWTPEEILRNIGELFKEHLQGKEFDIMIPIGGRLTKPSLSTGTELDGKTIKSIFNQKTIYVRPLQCLTSSSVDEENEIDAVFSETSSQDVDVEQFTSAIESRSAPEVEYIGTEQLACQSINTDVSDISFENDLELALKNSLNETFCNSDISLESIIQNLKNRINDDKITYFNIYREDIFNCCIRAMRRKTFCPFNKISVKFSDIEGNSEGAVDIGGPSREMFRLVLNYIKKSRLFFGSNKKYIRLDMGAVDAREYFEAGRLISLSLIHGGPGAHFFSESFYSVLIFEISDEFPTIDDIEEDLREKIVKLMDISDIATLQEYLTEESIFSIAGYQFIKTIEEKKKLLQDVIQFYGFHRVRPALEQFKEGLKTGQILELIQSHPTKFKDIMCSDKVKITANVLENLFTVEFSETGSSKRIVENRAISFWRDFLLDCEDIDMEVTPQDILIFGTGADTIPPLGFHFTPKIVFEHEDSNIYPKANTCALQLSLPTVHKTYETFKYHLAFGIGNCQDFAFA